MEKEREKILGILIQGVNKHYIFKAILAVLVLIWLPIVIKYFGVMLKLCESDGSLTILGFVTTITIYLLQAVIIFLAVIESRNSRNYQSDIEKLESNIKVYEIIRAKEFHVYDDRYDSIITYINKWNSKNIKYNDLLNPIRQLKCISNQIGECLKETISNSHGKLVVSIAYNFPTINDEWKWIDTNDLHGGLTIKELIASNESSFYKVYSKEEPIVFYLDKEEAHKDRYYIWDSIDRNKKNREIGSILCKEIRVSTQDEIIGRAILSVSSYSFKFDSDNNNEKKIQEIIENIILQPFEKQIRSELGLLYLHERQTNQNTMKKPADSKVKMEVAAENEPSYNT